MSLDRRSFLQGLSLGAIGAFGTMAQVRWGDEAVFLTRLPGGWRVLATGCAPRGDAPYDCAVKGA